MPWVGAFHRLKRSFAHASSSLLLHRWLVLVFLYEFNLLLNRKLALLQLLLFDTVARLKRNELPRFLLEKVYL